MQLPNYKLNIPGYTILYHNTSDSNIDSILANGLKADAGRDQNRGKDGDFVWATSIPNLRGYGGNTIAFKVPSNSIENYKVNDTEYTLPFDIPTSDILFVDRFIFPNTRLSDIPKLLDKFGKDKVIDTFTKNQNKLINISLDSLLDIINGNLNENTSIDDSYQPGEREAMNGLFNFENNTVRDALEKEFPGSCQGFWMSGSPMNWNSKVPVIADIKNKTKIINLLAREFGVSKDKVEFAGLEKTKVKKTDSDRHYSDNYIPYKTINKMVFNVDWKETTNKDLKKYQDYIRSSMKNQGIQWENQLLEGISEPQRKKLEDYIFKSFLYSDYGLAKMSKNLVDIKVGNDYVDIVFDFRDPVGTEVEVTDKRIDKVVSEHIADNFFKDNKNVPYFKIVPDEHRWLDNNALACFYNIVQYNENK